MQAALIHCFFMSLSDLKYPSTSAFTTDGSAHPRVRRMT